MLQSFDGGDGSCGTTPRNDGAACEHGPSCTEGNTCTGGVCGGGTARDCSGLDGACVAGTCDTYTGECITVPANEGASCDDGNLCTVGDACAFGVCRGSQMDCMAHSTGCTVGVCDPRDGTCGQVPMADGTACQAPASCSIGDSCLDGVCIAGTPKDCSVLDSDCLMGVCNPSSGDCVAVPANEGTACDDGVACTQGTVCTGGICQGGAQSCSATLDGCCPGWCTEDNDADCACPGELVGSTCMYIPNHASVTGHAAAKAVCTALGAGWDLCPESIVCDNPPGRAFLGDAGCNCGGGAATCACSSTPNVYVWLSSASGGAVSFAHWLRGPEFSACGSDVSCSLSGSETCGTPICCK